MKQFGTKNFAAVTRPYVTPFLSYRVYLDRVFGSRKDADGQFRIGNSLIGIDKKIILHKEKFIGKKAYLNC